LYDAREADWQPAPLVAVRNGELVRSFILQRPLAYLDECLICYSITQRNLGSVCKLGKQENGGERNHGSEVLGALFVARGNPAKLLDTVDETFNNITSAILFFIKATTMFLVLPSRNGVTNATSA